MFNTNTQQPLQKLDKSRINTWICFLMDKYKNKGLCIDEERIIIKRQLLVCCQDKYVVTNDDLSYIDKQINKIFIN